MMEGDGHDELFFEDIIVPTTAANDCLPISPQSVFQFQPHDSSPSLFDDDELDQVLLKDPVFKHKRKEFPSNANSWCGFQSSLLGPLHKKQRTAQQRTAPHAASSLTSSSLLGAEFSLGTSAAGGSPSSASSPTPFNNDQDQESHDDIHRFRDYQSEQWNDRFKDLVSFQARTGHCLVPHSFESNPALAQWVKRQRYQHKLKREGKHSTLTDEREHALEKLGFVWESHKAAWQEKFSELVEYARKNGDSNVPTSFSANKSLAIWVKCQRRQYKLFRQGKKSNMTQERIAMMESLNFCWNPRKLGS